MTTPPICVPVSGADLTDLAVIAKSTGLSAETAGSMLLSSAIMSYMIEHADLRVDPSDLSPYGHWFDREHF